MSDLEDLTARMRQFAIDRDWEQFHDPKSLVLALVGEVGELAELFQWLPASEAGSLAQAGELQSRVGQEMSDILLYLIRLSDVVGVDLMSAANAKLDSSEKRFAVDSFAGRAPEKK